MLPVGPEVELQTLRECRYRYPAETQADLRRVRSRFSDLRLHVDYYRFPNKEKKQLVYLAGTVPVLYEGSCYNIPVSIWLHQTHPVSHPRCYVCPSVSMVINPACSCADAAGLLHLDGLRNWTGGASSLSLLVSEMVQVFQKDMPLYARSAPGAPESTERPGRSFSLEEALEAVRLSADLPSALRFLSHRCPICQEQVSFSQIITMTHCCCRLCQTCFRSFFSSAIREKSVHQLVCPQCGQPEVKGQGRPDEVMDYFNLLDTQIITMTHCCCRLCQTCFRSFFSSAIREKSVHQLVCPQCGQPEVKGQGRPDEVMDYFNLLDTQWSPQHQGVSCQQFRLWQQQNQPDLLSTEPWSSKSLECHPAAAASSAWLEEAVFTSPAASVSSSSVEAAARASAGALTAASPQTAGPEVATPTTPETVSTTSGIGRWAASTCCCSITECLRAVCKQPATTAAAQGRARSWS
ncbi:unnamed protein product [Tetraodon nigroviridis]|uniref:Chromosome undetermined SCAF7478, whole genome shotgun sequence n=2 Tax=Tetraodon nigroviridis TaxID=99883 RepID=Q4TA00_TETNG|nr:unnamed protein product [Tetraodon nigroviridis]